MDTIELRFQYTQNEYVKAERQYLNANKTVRKYDIVLSGVFLLFSAANLFLFSFNAFSILVFGIVIVVTALGSYLYFLMPVLKFKQTAKYHEEYTLIFSKEMIRFKTLGIESQIKWDIYSSLWDNYDFYYLIQAPRMYTLVPKRVFKDQVEKQAFEELAQLNIKTIKHI